MNRLYDRNFAIAFLAQTAFTVTNSLLAHYARWVIHLGGDVLTAGSVSAFATMAGLLLRPVLAPWIDWLGPRVCWIAAGLVLFAASLANLLITHVGPELYILRSVMAAAIAVVFACGLTYVASTTPPERRTEAIGILGAGGFAGLLIGPWLGDLFLSGETRTHSNFIWFFVAAATAVLASVGLVAMLRPSPPPERHNMNWHPWEFIRSCHRYWPGSILLITLAFGICMTVPFVFLADYVDGIPGVELRWFFITYATAGLTLRIGLRNWPDQFGPRRVLTAGMMLFAVGMWSFLLVSPEFPHVILLAGMLCGGAHGLTFHSMISLAMQTFPPASRGIGSALALMGMDTGMLLGAQGLAFLARRNYDFLFHAVAISCLLSLAIYLLRSRGAPRFVQYSGEPIVEEAVEMAVPAPEPPAPSQPIAARQPCTEHRCA